MRANRLFLPFLLLVLLSGCASLGLQPAQTFEQRWAYAQSQTTALREASTRALDAKLISSTDMEYTITLADRSTQMLRMARQAQNIGDLKTAEGRLTLVIGVLSELERYLQKRNVQ